MQGLHKLEEITGLRVDAVFPIEIGGSNGLAALLLALRSGLPVVDCDGMGRAFPESQRVIFNIRGHSASPAILTDSKGSCRDGDPRHLPKSISHAVSVAMGGICHLIRYTGTGRQVREQGCSVRSRMRSQLAAACERREGGRGPVRGPVHRVARLRHSAAPACCSTGKSSI